VHKASHWQQATIEITRYDHSPCTLVITFNCSQVHISRASTPQSLSLSPLARTINCSPGSQALLEVTHQDHSIGITLLLLVCTTCICVLFFAFHLWWIVHSVQRQQKGCNNISSFLQRQTAPIACSLCEGCTRHDLHILVTAPFCCDRKARAASAQSFTLWQQATIEITCHDHSIIACSHHIYIWVLFFAHIPFVVNHTFNATPMEKLRTTIV